MSAPGSIDAWTALLAHATHLAQAARAWSEEASGARMRASVVPLVQLAAVEIAMDSLVQLAPAHRAYARDQADLLTGRASEALRTVWSGEPMPEGLLECMARARRAVSSAIYAGLRALRWSGPESLVVPPWPASVLEVRGTLAVMEPGTVALPGEVVAWWADREDLACEGCVVEPLASPVQVYRRFDQAGRFEHAATVALHEELPAGMPMLVPLCVAGEAVGALVREAEAWRALQRGAGIPGA